MSNPFLEAARGYLAAGLHPIPCEPKGKRPMLSWTPYQDTAPTPEEVTLWWQAWPEANVGLVLGRGVLAVDIDSADGRERLLAAGVELPADAPSVTTGKGAHIYLAGTTGDRVGLVQGVDIRGKGYVIAPPSIHPTGAVYQWVVPFGALPPAPPALMSLLGSAGTSSPAGHVAQGGADWLTQALVGVSEGGRDHTCTRLAGYLLGKGLPQDAVELILQGWAERCSPAFPADQVSKCVASIAKREGVHEGPPSGIAELVRVTMAAITEPEATRAKPAATNLGSLDAILAGGLYPGDYVILGARPSVGKTALALQIGRRLAQSGQGVLFVSCEMTKTALVRRLLSQESAVSAENLKTGKLIELESKMLSLGAERLAALPIWVTSDIHTSDQLDEAVKVFTPGQLGLIVVDYLQLVGTADNVREPRQRVERVSKDIRRLTVRYEIPCIALSSLSRPPKGVKEWRPSLADLRESGELEHDADIVWLMHRDLKETRTELDVAKARDGQVGSVTLEFNGNVLTFTESK